MFTFFSLFVYPVKSCRGVAVSELTFDRQGPINDRRFMVVEADTGLMVSQRHDPTMARITVALESVGLVLSVLEQSELFIPFERVLEGRTIMATVHDDAGIRTIDQGEEAARWFSSFLGRDVRLVRIPNTTHRVVHRDSGRGVEVGLSDGYPLLVITHASMQMLNRRLFEDKAERADVTRFRPNIVVGGCEVPNDEDFWSVFKTSSMTFNGVKPCDRCAISTLNPLSGERTPNGQPTRTLARYRTFRSPKGRKVYFGMNANHLTTGTIRAGEPFDVTARFETPPF